MNTSTYTKGYSLIEVLVAIAVLMLSIVGPMTIAVKGIQSAQYVSEQNTAFFLAQEGISAINKIRNDAGLEKFSGNISDSWAWVDSLPAACFDASKGCNTDFVTPSNLIMKPCDDIENCVLHFYDDGGGATRVKYQLGGNGAVSPFTRVIAMEEGVIDNEVIVTSTVSWVSGLFRGPQQVSVSSTFFNIYQDI